MRAMLERLIGEDVKFVVNLPPELAPVMADRGQVEQIVMNLAVNARDAMPKGGTLTIETANVELDEPYAKTRLDGRSGPLRGAHGDRHGHRHDAGRAGARSSSRSSPPRSPGKGTGLGLATVHGIVLRSGGSVNVDSEVGKGTSFTVYFPRADGAETAVDAPPPPQARPRAGARRCSWSRMRTGFAN